MANVNVSPVETRQKLHYAGYIPGDPAMNCFLFAFVVIFKLSKKNQIL